MEGQKQACRTQTKGFFNSSHYLTTPRIAIVCRPIGEVQIRGQPTAVGESACLHTSRWSRPVTSFFPL
jgi:hypothetical protein